MTKANSIPPGWQKKKIKELANINQAIINSDYPYKEIQYIDIASVENRKVQQLQIFKIEEAPSRAKRIVKDNDILISTVRPNLKHYCFIENAYKNLIASTGFAVITATKADPRFLYYLLTSDSFTDTLTRIAEGHTSAYPSFNPEVLENAVFELPDVLEQEEISKILTSLDHKIELLQKQNKTLEHMAQTLFKEWFINFNFTDKNGKPYKSSGGKMIDSELGKIPEGWHVGKLGDYCRITRGASPRPIHDWLTEEPNNTPWIKISDATANDSKFIFSTDQEILSSGEKHSVVVEKGELIVSNSATPGLPRIVQLRACVHDGWLIIRNYEDSFSKWYLLHLFENLRSYFIKQGSGAVFTNLKTDIVKTHVTVLPDYKTRILFDNASSSLWNKILENSIQIQLLSHLRDTLWPKLMKGEIRINQ